MSIMPFLTGLGTCPRSFHFSCQNVCILDTVVPIIIKTIQTCGSYPHVPVSSPNPPCAHQHKPDVLVPQQMPANRSIVASGSADGTVMMWDVRATARGPTQTLRGHRDRVTGLLASGASVYSCSEVKRWLNFLTFSVRARRGKAL